MPSHPDTHEFNRSTNGPVVSVIHHTPKTTSVAHYEDWLKRLVPIAKSYPGHSGVEIIRPIAPDDAYTIILHFDSAEHLKNWLMSETRRHLVDEIIPHLRMSETIQTKSAFDFWFTPPVGRPARPYKQFLVTLSAILPLTMIVPWALQPLFIAVPLLAVSGLRHLVVAAVIVGLMVYVIMPRYTRAISRWLFS